jgi:hypothetical protein
MERKSALTLVLKRPRKIPMRSMIHVCSFEASRTESDHRSDAAWSTGHLPEPWRRIGHQYWRLTEAKNAAAAAAEPLCPHNWGL